MLQKVRQKVTMVFQNGGSSIDHGWRVCAFPLRERHDLAEEQMLQVVKGLLEMVASQEWKICCRPTCRLV